MLVCMVQHHLLSIMVKVISNEFAENTYIINKNKDSYVIDPGTNYDEVKQYLQDNELEVKGILLTHGHFDHIYAVDNVVDDFDCDILIHEKERDFLFDPNLNLSGTTYKRFTITNKHKVKTFQEGEVIKLGYDDIQILHTPGHTRGSVSFKYKRFLFSGDTLFKGTVGRTDLPTSSRVEMERSLQKILKECNDNTIVYPGHGHFTTILNEKYENPYIKK